MKHRIFTIPLVFTLSFILLSGCRTANTSRSKSDMYFDTIVSVEIYGAQSQNADKMLEDCMSICEHYDRLWNKNIKTSDISKINNSSSNTVTVDPDTIKLLSNALSYCAQTGGRFDISVAPLSQLWDFHGQSAVIPDAAALKEACSHVDHNCILIDASDDSVTLTDPKAAVDVGSMAKGFVADRIAEYLKDQSITGAIINMGGDMRLVGSKPDGSLFNIGIQDPFGSGSCTQSLYLSDTAVATSGTYERCFTVDGRRYHHILDTVTGYPVDTDIESVTVISGNAEDCDCLCTIAIIDGSEKALDMIEQTENTEAVMILSDNTVIMSSGAGKYLRQQ